MTRGGETTTLPRIGKTKLACASWVIGPAAVAAALVTSVVLAGSVHAGDEAATKPQTPTAQTQPTPAQGHQGHEGRAMPGKAPATQSGGVTGKLMTVVGEVMDPACYLEAGAKSIGPGHFQCAVDCAKSGQTLAIYDRDQDRIYFIAGELPGKNPNAPLFPYIHKKVDVTGTVYQRSGVYGIVIVKVAPHDEKAGARAAASGVGSPSRATPSSSAPGDSARPKPAGM